MRRLALAAVVIAVVACGGASRARPAPPPLTEADAPDLPAQLGGEADGPSAEAILDAADARSGGEAALAAVRTMRLRGSMTVEPMGKRGRFEMVYGEGERVYHHMDVPGLATRTAVVDGEHVWEITSAGGARLLEGAEAAELRREPRPGEVRPWRTQYRSVAMEGPSELDGRPVWMIRVTDRTGDRELHYYDRESKLPLGIDSVHHGPAGEVDIRTRFVTFLQSGDLTLPGTMVMHDARGLTITMTIDSVELNPRLPTDLFTPPPAIRAQIKRRR